RRRNPHSLAARRTLQDCRGQRQVQPRPVCGRGEDVARVAVMVRFATRTHPGRAHADNEDAIGVDAEHRLWVLADGMGGHASGEVASAIVRDTMLRSTEMPLADAVRAAHRAVVDAAAQESHYRGMGSTVVAIALDGGAARTAWVGD